jgi:hypothetical protein
MKHLLTNFVTQLRHQIYFSKNAWEFSYYFEKLTLLLFYCSFNDISIDNFPPEAFFKHGSHSRPDDVDETKNNPNDLEFINRFVLENIQQPKKENSIKKNKTSNQEQFMNESVKEANKKSNFDISGYKQIKPDPIYKKEINEDETVEVGLLKQKTYLPNDWSSSETENIKEFEEPKKKVQKKVQKQVFASKNSKFFDNRYDDSSPCKLTNLVRHIPNQPEKVFKSDLKEKPKRNKIKEEEDHQSNNIFIEEEKSGVNYHETSDYANKFFIEDKYSLATPIKKNRKELETTKTNTKSQIEKEWNMMNINSYNQSQEQIKDLNDNMNMELEIEKNDENDERVISNNLISQNIELEIEESDESIELEIDFKDNKQLNQIDNSTKTIQDDLFLESPENLNEMTNNELMKFPSFSELPEKNSIPVLTQHLRSNSRKMLDHCKMAFQSTICGRSPFSTDPSKLLNQKKSEATVELLDQTIVRLDKLDQKVRLLKNKHLSE